MPASPRDAMRRRRVEPLPLHAERPRAMPVKAVLFDAYGTLFDVHSVAALAESLFPGRGAALSAAWRTKQLEYTWLRTMSNRYRDFRHVTGDALEHAAETLQLPLEASARSRLLDAYLRLAPFPENIEVLRDIHRRGIVIGTLSNGTPSMLEAALASAGMRELFTHVLSVDAAGCFKTDARAYALGPAAVGAPAADIVFVSSNAWDAIGATWYGYRTFWVNRAGAPRERLGATPHGMGRSLADLVPFLDDAANG
jgi:2-haloacid dehalogenase